MSSENFMPALPFLFQREIIILRLVLSFPFYYSFFFFSLQQIIKELLEKSPIDTTTSTYVVFIQDCWHRPAEASDDVDDDHKLEDDVVDE